MNTSRKYKYMKFEEFYDQYNNLIKEDPDAIHIDYDGDPKMPMYFTDYNAHSFLGIEKNGQRALIYSTKNRNKRETHIKLIDYVFRTCYLFNKISYSPLQDMVEYFKRKDIRIIFDDNMPPILPEDIRIVASKYKNTRNIREIFGRVWIISERAYGAVWNPKRFKGYSHLIIKMLEELRVNPNESQWELNENEWVSIDSFIELSSKTSTEYQRELDAKRAIHVQPGMKRALGQPSSSSIGSEYQANIANQAGQEFYAKYKTFIDPYGLRESIE